MRLGILLDRWRPEGGGGAEVHTHKLVRRALDQGDAVLVATLEGEAPPPARTLRIPAPRRRPARDRAFATRGAAALREAGASCVLAFRHAPDCDVYLPHGGLVLDAIAARDRALGRSRWTSAVRHALSARVRYFVEAEQAVLARASGPTVICLSRRHRARTRMLYPAAERRLVVIPNGVDATHFDPLPSREAGTALRERWGLARSYVGLLLAHQPTLKGVRTAIAAMARGEVRTLDPPFHLVVAGGRLDRRARRLARRLGVRARIHEVGAVADPRPLYAAADVLVHATYFDPCSLACLEGLAMEVPVITTPENGAAEIMGSKGGIVVESPGDASALAVALRVLADASLRAVTGDDGRYEILRHAERDRLDEILALCRAVRSEDRCR